MGSTISNINDMIENSKDEYLKLLDSGMMWEIYPWVTGNWEKDKDKFIQTKFEEKTKVQRIMDDGQGDEHLLDKHEKQIEENWAKMENEDEILDVILENRRLKNVENPDHYTSGDIECIDAIKAALTPEEFRGFLKGNCFKYLWREGKKNGKEDLQKMNNYLNRLINETT